MQTLPVTNREGFQRESAIAISRTTQLELHVEIPLKHPLNLLRGGDSYKIDYSDVAVKSRCVAEMVNIACIINNLCWSGRRDSNPRPSAPKADALPGCATPRLNSLIVSRIAFPSTRAQDHDPYRCSSHTTSQINRSTGMVKTSPSPQTSTPRNAQSRQPCRRGSRKCSCISR